MSHTHTHTSHHQDLDLVLFIRPVKEGDAGVLPEEGRGSLSSLWVLDLLEQLHDLLGCAVLFGRQGLGVSLNR